VSGYADYTSAFDQYRVRMIEYSLIPLYDFNNAGSFTKVGLMHTVIDYDDSNALTTVASATEYGTCVVADCTTAQKRTFVPHVAVGAYGGAVFTNYKNEVADWIDTTSSAVNHFGIKTACSTTSTIMSFSAVVRVWLQFRNSL